MKTSIMITGLLLSCSLHALLAQDTIQKKMIHASSLTLRTEPPKDIHGALYQVKDTSILFSTSSAVKDFRMGTYLLSEVNVLDIQSIHIATKQHTMLGILIGAASGFVIGGLVGIASNVDDPSSWVRIPDSWAFLGGGILCAPVGALFGGAIGASIKIQIPIQGKMSNYHSNKKMLNNYAIKKY